MYKTMKISQFIKELKEITKLEGDLPVILASDNEGNSYSAVTGKRMYGVDNGIIIIYPSFETSQDLEDFN